MPIAADVTPHAHQHQSGRNEEERNPPVNLAVIADEKPHDRRADQIAERTAQTNVAEIPARSLCHFERAVVLQGDCGREEDRHRHGAKRNPPKLLHQIDGQSGYAAKHDQKAGDPVFIL